MIAESCREVGGTHEQASTLNAQWRLHKVLTTKNSIHIQHLAAVCCRMLALVTQTPALVEFHVNVGGVFASRRVRVEEGRKGLV